MDKETVNHLGYNLEELYFDRVNHELIQKLREKLDHSRSDVASRSSKEEYWMRCPKCGGQLEEISSRTVMIDRCVSCRGIYLDAGELALLLQVTDVEK